MHQTNITILSQLFYPELVSTGQTLTELAEELTHLGHAITVYAAPPTIDPFRKKTDSLLHYNNIKIQRLPSTQFSKSNSIGRLLNAVTFTVALFFKLLLDKNKTPILVLTNPPFIGWIMALISRLKNRPFIYLVFDVYPETAIVNGVLSPTSLLTKLWKKLNKATYDQANKILVIGRCMHAIVKPYVKNPTKIVQIHVWSDDKGIQTSTYPATYFRKKWNLESKFILLYSGNMGRFHDIETIVDAARQLHTDIDIHFLFVGEGYKKSWAQHYCLEHSLSNCSFHTYVPRDQLGALLSSADIGLVSLLENQLGLSVPSKTFGLLAAGCPVIGILPKQCEISYLLSKHECGVVTEPGNTDALMEQILMLKQNNSHLKKMKENGKNCIKNHFTLHHAATLISNEFQSIQEN